MKALTALIMIVAAAATTAAQQSWTYNSTTGIFTCPAYSPNGAFCAGDSLSTNIIIRCSNGVGQPGNCNDNLSGEPPNGVWYAPCWQTSPTSADAACSKNCIVYGGSGNANGTFTLTGCTPEYPVSSSSSVSSTVSSFVATSSSANIFSISSSSATSVTALTTSSADPVSVSASALSTLLNSASAESSASQDEDVTVQLHITATITTTCADQYSTFVSAYTTTEIPSISLSNSVTTTGGSSESSASPSSKPYSIVLSPGGPGGSTGSVLPLPNGTFAAGGGSGKPSAFNVAATPVGSTTFVPPLTAGAAVTKSASILATLGLFVVYLL